MGLLGGVVFLEIILPTKTYKQGLWLGKYGHVIPKRTLLYSNSPFLRKLDRGKLLKEERGGDSGVRKYKDKKGRTRVVGSPKLKTTQPLACGMCIELLLSTFSKSMIARHPPSHSNQMPHPAPTHFRKYPVKYARQIVDMLPLIRSGPENIMPDEAPCTIPRGIVYRVV